MGLSGSEIMLIHVAVLLMFGSKKIPELAKGIGKGMREFRKATDEIKREIENSANEVKEEVQEIKRDVEIAKNDIAEAGSDTTLPDNNSYK